MVAYLGRIDRQEQLGLKRAAEGKADRIWVMDRGDDFASEYCVPQGRRASLHRRDAEGKAAKIRAAASLGRLAIRSRGVEVKLCPSPDGAETFILCRSEDRRQKEKAMHERFARRIEEGLRQIEAGCAKRKYKLITIGKRLGKLLGRNSRAAGLFETDVIEAADGRAQLVWRKVDAWRDWAQLSEGCYLLRSNVNDWSAEDLWRAYIHLTEAEEAFRIHKTDLGLRPIWHQKERRVDAHILVCFLAYAVRRTLGQLRRQAGLGDEPRRVFDEIARIKAVDVVLPTRSGVEIRRRCVTRPDDHQTILLQHLGLTLPTNLPITDHKTNEM